MCAFLLSPLSPVNTVFVRIFLRYERLDKGLSIYIWAYLFIQDFSLAFLWLRAKVSILQLLCAYKVKKLMCLMLYDSIERSYSFSGKSIPWNVVIFQLFTFLNCSKVGFVVGNQTNYGPFDLTILSDSSQRLCSIQEVRNNNKSNNSYLYRLTFKFTSVVSVLKKIPSMWLTLIINCVSY